MYLTALAILLFIVTTSAQLSQDEPAKGYHRLVGIPAAKRIKEREDRIHLEDTARVYKGEEVSSHDQTYYSFFGGLLVYFYEETEYHVSYCASSLLTTKRLVTAAHCWDDGYSRGSKLIVVLGSTFLYYGGLRIVTEKVVVHPQYEARFVLNDIAIIYLPYSVYFTSKIFPIAVPEGRDVNQTFVGYWVRALGEGITETYPNDGDRILKYVTLQIVSESECAKSLKYTPEPGELCTSGKGGLGTCRGDSGGPLFTYTNRKFLIGITSRAVEDKCGSEEVGVNIRVSHYLDFINENAILPQFIFQFTQPGNGELHENITVIVRKVE